MNESFLIILQFVLNFEGDTVASDVKNEPTNIANIYEKSKWDEIEKEISEQSIRRWGWASVASSTMLSISLILGAAAKYQGNTEFSHKLLDSFLSNPKNDLDSLVTSPAFMAIGGFALLTIIAVAIWHGKSVAHDNKFGVEDWRTLDPDPPAEENDADQTTPVVGKR